MSARNAFSRISFHDLPPMVWERLEGVLERFEDAWRSGKRPVLEDYLKGDQAEQQALLAELVHADLHYRLKGGEAVRVEAYFARYPALRAASPVALNLIATEYELRQSSKDRGTVAEYLQRFPEYREQLAARLPISAPALPQETANRSAATGETMTSAGKEPPMATHLPDRAVITERPPDNPKDYLAPPQAPDELGRLGGYRVLKILGQGGMGVVFLAEDVHLRRRIALKVMRPNVAASPEARQRFIKEAQATAALEHEHIIAIFQVGEDRGVPFLAMPLLQGETLEDRLRREVKLPVAEAVRLAREIAEGLAAAHDKGLIHRDIKPVNVWLARPLTLTGSTDHAADTPSRAKILDFGLARSLEGDVHLTQTGAIVGTPAYMAPEQARGERIDGRSDLFSLGCVLYRMLTGERPFKGQTPMSQLRSLEMDEPPPPQQVNPQIPRPVSQLTMRLLAKNPAQRPATTQAVVKWLRAIESDLTGVTAKPVYPNAVPVKLADEDRTSVTQMVLARLQKVDVRQRWLIATTLLLVLSMGILGAGLAIRKIASASFWTNKKEEPPVASPAGTPALSLGEHFSQVVTERPPDRLPGGKALRLGSLVPRPAPIPGIDSWTLATDHYGATVNTIDFSGDARLMLCGSNNYWNHFDLSEYSLKPDISSNGYYQALSPDGKRWVRSSGQSVELGIVGSKSKPKSIPGFFDGVSGFAWSPDSSQLAVASKKNLKLLDAEKAALIEDADWDLPYYSPTLSWSPDGKMLACAEGLSNAEAAKKILLLNPETGKLIKELTSNWTGQQIIWPPIAAAEHIAVWRGTDPNTPIAIDVLHIPSGKLVHSIKGPTTAPAWDRKGRFLAYGVNKTVVLYDIEKDEEYASFTAHDRVVTCVAFAPNNKTLITAGEDKTLHFWSAATWKEPKPELLGTMIFLNTGRVLAFSTTGHFTGSPGVEQDIQYEYLETAKDEPERDDYEKFCKKFNWTNEPKKVGLFE